MCTTRREGSSDTLVALLRKLARKRGVAIHMVTFRWVNLQKRTQKLSRGQCNGIVAEAPFRRFPRAKTAFRCELTMYLGQGQIAIKPVDFDRGVVLLAGFLLPIRDGRSPSG